MQLCIAVNDEHSWAAIKSAVDAALTHAQNRQASSAAQKTWQVILGK